MHGRIRWYEVLDAVVTLAGVGFGMVLGQCKKKTRVFERQIPINILITMLIYLPYRLVLVPNDASRFSSNVT
jgi:hypothetical protein